MADDDFGDSSIDNAPLRSRQFGAITLRGYSRAGIQSYWMVPEWRMAFDIGALPWDFRHIGIWCLSHMHLDHMAALPVMVARRAMLKLPPPTIYLPIEALDDTRQLLNIVGRLDGGKQECQLIGVQAGDSFALEGNRLLTVWNTEHTVPSRGYCVWNRKNKLKPEFVAMTGPEIARLRNDGFSVTEEVREPLLAYTGDTSPPGLDRAPEAFQARILLTEISFLKAKHRRETIHQYGHMHLDDFIDRADRFHNDWIVGGHLSSRYHLAEVPGLLQDRLPESLRQKLVMWL